MKVFITGATGFIGFAIARAFARAGYDVRGLVRTPEKGKDLARHEIIPAVGSLEDTKGLAQAARDAQIIIHAAAAMGPSMFAIDRAAVEALLDVEVRTRLPRRFIYTSGVWVYGSTGRTLVDEGSPLDPTALVAPRVEVERMVTNASTDTLQTIVIRPGCVYGGSGSLTATWFESAAREGAARIVGDGENRWAMVHVEDLAHLYLRAAERASGREVFNATDRSRFTVAECARAASLAAGAGGKIASTSLSEARAAMGPFADCLVLDQHVDARKAVRLLGWEPRHGGFVDGVDRYHAAWKARQVQA